MELRGTDGVLDLSLLAPKAEPGVSQRKRTAAEAELQAHPAAQRPPPAASALAGRALPAGDARVPSSCRGAPACAEAPRSAAQHLAEGAPAPAPQPAAQPAQGPDDTQAEPEPPPLQGCRAQPLLGRSGGRMTLKVFERLIGKAMDKGRKAAVRAVVVELDGQLQAEGAQRADGPDAVEPDAAIITRYQMHYNVSGIIGILSRLDRIPIFLRGWRSDAEGRLVAIATTDPRVGPAELPPEGSTRVARAPGPEFHARVKVAAQPPAWPQMSLDTHDRLFPGAPRAALKLVRSAVVEADGGVRGGELRDSVRVAVAPHGSITVVYVAGLAAALRGLHLRGWRGDPHGRLVAVASADRSAAAAAPPPPDAGCTPVRYGLLAADGASTSALASDGMQAGEVPRGRGGGEGQGAASSAVGDGGGRSGGTNPKPEPEPEALGAAGAAGCSAAQTQEAVGRVLALAMQGGSSTAPAAAAANPNAASAPGAVPCRAPGVAGACIPPDQRPALTPAHASRHACAATTTDAAAKALATASPTAAAAASIPATAAPAAAPATAAPAAGPVSHVTHARRSTALAAAAATLAAAPAVAAPAAAAVAAATPAAAATLDPATFLATTSSAAAAAAAAPAAEAAVAPAPAAVAPAAAAPAAAAPAAPVSSSTPAPSSNVDSPGRSASTTTAAAAGAGWAATEIDLLAANSALVQHMTHFDIDSDDTAGAGGGGTDCRPLLQLYDMLTQLHVMLVGLGEGAAGAAQHGAHAAREAAEGVRREAAAAVLNCYRRLLRARDREELCRWGARLLPLAGITAHPLREGAEGGGRD